MATAQSRGTLHPLDSFYAIGSKDMPVVREITAAAIPEPQFELLVHDHDMTPTLEAHHGDRITLDSRQVVRNGTIYAREVLLKLVSSGRVVEYGASRIHLDTFPDNVQEVLLEGKTPLGTIMNEYGVPHLSRPERFLQIDAGKVMREAFGLEGAEILYGRQNVVRNPQGRPMYEVIEILPP